jgi:hypothetical protein
MPDSSWRHQQHTAHGAMPQQQQPRDAAPQLAAWSLQDGDSSSTSTTTTSSSSSSTAGGTFFASRAAMLQRLQLGQLQQQRQHLLALHSRPLYRYALGEGGSSIVRQRKPSSRRASQQRSFARAQQQPQQPVPDASAYQTHQQPPPPLPPPPQQQQQQQQRQAASAQPYAVSLEALQQQELQGARRQQQQQALDGSSQPATQPPAAAAAPPPAPHGPSRGVSLAVFVYCCSATQLLALAWDLGLSPTALRIVPRLEDADAVVHVKPAAGEKHYQYDEVRAGCWVLGAGCCHWPSLRPVWECTADSACCSWSVRTQAPARAGGMHCALCAAARCTRRRTTRKPPHASSAPRPLRAASPLSTSRL